MIKFTMKEGRLQMEHTFLMVPEFVDIWEWDKTKDKKKAHKLLFYVYLMCDLNEECPTKDLNLSNKDQQCRFLVFKDKGYQFKDDELVLVSKAIEAYILLNEIPEERMLRTYDEKMDQLRELLGDTLPVIRENTNENTGMINFTTNVDIINKALKEVSNLVKAKHDLREAVLAGRGAGHVRGKVKLSPRDKRKLTIRK